MRNLVTALLAMMLPATLGAVDLVLVSGAGRDDVPAIERLGVVVNDARGGALTVEADASQQAALRALGFGVKVKVPGIDGVYRHNSLTFDTDAWYMPYTTFRDTMITIAQNNASFIKLETLGVSVNNRLVLAMKFSDNPQADEEEPAVHFEANIHGDEKITWGVLFEMVKYLASGYGTDTLVTRLVDSREIWLVPLVNPDGYESSSRYNGHSVDLNRNWGWMWQSGSGRGSAPMSEPESEGMVGHIMRHPFTTYVSYHAGTEFISHPWSYCRSSVNTIPELALINWLSARYDLYTHYTYGQGADSMYSINGSTKDFNYGYDGSMGWSIEVHYSKTPPASEIIPTFNENRPAILEFCHHAGKGIHGTVTDVENGLPVHAQVIVNPANWHSYTDTAHGDYHRFYLPGTYTVSYRAPGYRDTTVTGVTVPNSGDSSVTLHVTLTPDAAAPLHGFRVMYCAYINSPSSNRTYAVRALGPSDDVHYQLDGGKYICIDMDKPVHDLPGDELVVHRNGGSGSATVKGSNSWTGPWTTIGTAASDESSFDIGAAGLDSVRFVRIEASTTFYLDAVEGVNYTGIAAGPRASRGRLTVRPLANPATGAVRLRFNRAPVPGARVLVTDAAGRLVCTLAADGAILTWDARTAAPGVYFCRVAGDDPVTTRVVLGR
ncbi:carboxypeptidase regulatory-like domain-containing protein [candidate division WOR-3 bacterium]|nr:carboxypeptidase regulatory-like domain-containing protein [candidate division WOR-3 bacterium]